jgi:hypothetical protein
MRMTNQVSNSVHCRWVIAGSVGVLALLGAMAPASAQVVYAQPAPLDPLFAPADESYGTSPSFEVSPTPYGGAPAVRVVERCQSPNGWNVTDFGRDVNGIPAGLDHTCPVERLGGRLRSRY